MSKSQLPTVPGANNIIKDEDPPLIPYEVLNGPTQRLYIVSIYVALNAWRLYNWLALAQSNTESLWLFLKWTAIDGIFLYNVPSLRIPYLRWPFSITTTIFLVHTLLTGMLMFRAYPPLELALVTGTKVLSGSDMSVLEQKVRHADLLPDRSLILGKQIINILPEASARLSSQKQSFCLGPGRMNVEIPVLINQTTPIQIELLRFDFETNENETVSVPPKMLKSLLKDAHKGYAKNDKATPRTLRIPVTKPGLYRLHKVVDQSKLEVQKRASDILIVECPKATIKRAHAHRCKGELSDLEFEVTGTPPMKVKYSRSVNGENKGFSFQSIHPEHLVSPLAALGLSGALSLNSVDISWARSLALSVPINESLAIGGEWSYAINEIHDACGNVANFSLSNEGGEQFSLGSQLEQRFLVHERPTVAINGYDAQRSLKLPEGKAAPWPLFLGSTGRKALDTPITVSYLFTPIENLQENGEHMSSAEQHEVTLSTHLKTPSLQKAGLYSLKSVKSQFCIGEVQEPATFLLVNPPRPTLSLASEKIFDKCAGNSIGLLVDVDLIGTPPFNIHYDVRRKGSNEVSHENVISDRFKYQLELRPPRAGHYTYVFRSIDDNVYRDHSLKGSEFVLEQDVKPPASAHFLKSGVTKRACIEEPIEARVQLQGEGPWDLEYEVVQGKKRTKYKANGIETEEHTISTEKLSQGGEYSLALASIKDKTGCKIFLGEEIKIDVRRQRPKAAFGLVDSARTVSSLEGRQIGLPLKLTGESPWTLLYRNLNDPASNETVRRTLFDKNGYLEVNAAGTYEIQGVLDATCPGTVEDTAKSFEVKYVPRPQIRIAESAVIEQSGSSFMKKEVCEEDEDAMEIHLSGTPPFQIKYQQKVTPERGSKSVANKELISGLNLASIKMDTSRAGKYEYHFLELGDNSYDHDPRKHSPLVVEQIVVSRPSARFLNPGKTYKYCKAEVSGDEIIPIVLEGVAPFYIEIAVNHHSGAKPEIIKIPNIDTNSYNFRIPDRVLSLGHHIVTLRKIRDARGCQRKTEYEGPRVQVTVSDVPAIFPLDSRSDYCVYEWMSFTLSGTPPFSVHHSFNGVERRGTVPTTTFRRSSKDPGDFTILSVSDSASDCLGKANITRTVHPLPGSTISKGRTSEVDIPEGGEVEISFDFTGTPPFEFTYTRSTTTRRGEKPMVLETRHEVSFEHSKTVLVRDEGTYEVISIKDRYCAYSNQRAMATPSQRMIKSS